MDIKENEYGMRSPMWNSQEYMTNLRAQGKKMKIKAQSQSEMCENEILHLIVLMSDVINWFSE